MARVANQQFRDFDFMRADLARLAQRFDRVGPEAEDRFNQSVRQWMLGTASAIRKSAGQRAMWAKAARTVHVTGGARPALEAGGDELFMGAEFGGGGAPGSAGGRRTNGRRSTKQFGKHTGERGRWFFPTFRKELPKLSSLVVKTLDDLVDL